MDMVYRSCIPLEKIMGSPVESLLFFSGLDSPSLLPFWQRAG